MSLKRKIEWMKEKKKKQKSVLLSKMNQFKKERNNKEK